MRDVRLELVEDPARDGVNGLVSIRLFEPARVAESVIDADDVQAIAFFGANRVLRFVRVPFPRQNQYFVATVSERAGVGLRVQFGASLGRWRESVDDL